MQTAAFNNREGGSDVRRWGGGYHVHMPRRFNGSRGSKNGRDLRAGLLGHVDALCELGIACRMAMACTARCSRAPPPHLELAAASALLFKASRGRHSCLISDFKCRAAAGEAHAANWFMSEWFKSRKLGAKSGLGPAQMEEEDGSSGGGLSRAPLQHRRPPVALDSDIRRRVPAVADLGRGVGACSGSSRRGCRGDSSGRTLRVELLSASGTTTGGWRSKLLELSAPTWPSNWAKFTRLWEQVAPKLARRLHRAKQPTQGSAELLLRPDNHSFTVLVVVHPRYVSYRYMCGCAYGIVIPARDSQWLLPN